MLRRMKRTLALLLLLAVVGCREQVTSDRMVSTYPADLKKHRTDRETRLKREDGWLTLVGLFWLDPGANTFGSAKTNKIVMPAKAPAQMGTLSLADGRVTLAPDPGATLSVDGKPVTGPVELKPDVSEGGPTRVTFGGMHFLVIKRGERFGIRVRDPENPARVHFKGLDYYTPDERWRVTARLEPHDPPKRIPITNIVGMTSEEASPGSLVFELNGQTHRLDPIIEEGSDDLFIIFRDGTSRDTTYPAGRYLYATAPGPDGKVIVDFNKAYNPPCAFTPFATCPLPPLQNRLPVRVEAGEKNYKEAHG
jgi:uncharacterized protein